MSFAETKCSTAGDMWYSKIYFSKCFIFSTKSITWFEAREFCTSLNADLATINSLEAVKTISAEIKRGGQYWVGLHRISWKDKNKKGTILYIRFKYQFIS